MIRTQHIVSVDGGYRVATLDLPAGAPIGLVVCAHGLTGDKSGPADLLARWSAALAKVGLAAVRFDFGGSGDSAGAFPQTTFGGMVDDFVDVWRWARNRLGDLSSVAAGISTGGAVAVAASGELTGLACLLLISADLADGYGPPPANATPLRAGEFHLGRRLLAGRAARPVRPLVGGARRPVRLIYGDRDVEVARHVDEFHGLSVDTVEIAGCGHLIETGRARQEMYAASVQFILAALTSARGTEATR